MKAELILTAMLVIASLCAPVAIVANIQANPISYDATAMVM